MIESQTSMNEWAEQTFGPMRSVPYMLARANEEMAELLSAITAPEFNASQVAEECADVVGPLMRIADSVSDDITEFLEHTPMFVPSSVVKPAIQANNLIGFLFERLMSGAATGNDISRLIRRIVVKLAEVCSGCEIPLSEAFDKKMAICRKRQWLTAGDGVGKHIIQGATGDPNLFQDNERRYFPLETCPQCNSPHPQRRNLIDTKICDHLWHLTEVRLNES